MAEENTNTLRTTVLVAVSQSSKGYPHPSISSRHAFDWILKNITKPCCKQDYKLLILHVQVPDSDGEYRPLNPTPHFIFLLFFSWTMTHITRLFRLRAMMAGGSYINAL
jgi:hypothetical protein